MLIHQLRRRRNRPYPDVWFGANINTSGSNHFIQGSTFSPKSP
jgi:hypothetical protein